MTMTSQEFEVEVIELDAAAGEFTGRLYDITNRERPEEIATFNLSDVAEGDRSKIVPGTVFRWRMISWSEFKFDESVWTGADIERAKQEAEKYREILGWT